MAYRGVKRGDYRATASAALSPSASRMARPGREGASRAARFWSDAQAPLKIVYYGTALFVGILFLLLLVSYFLVGNDYVGERIIWCTLALLYVAVAGVLMYRQKYQLAAWLSVGLYLVLAAIILWQWSVFAQIGVLTLGFVIVLAGVLLGGKYIIPVTIVTIIVLAALQALEAGGAVQPHREWLYANPTVADVLSYAAIFAVFALVSWVSRRQMELALRKAMAAEAALQREKDSLAARLEENARRLRIAQQQELRQLYQFIEMGQLSSSVLHELANHVTALTFDIDDLERRHRGSRAVKNARQSLAFIENMVNQTARRLHTHAANEEFEVGEVLKLVSQTVKRRADRAGVRVSIGRAAKVVRLRGDPLRLEQAVTVLVSNAIDAYEGASTTAKRVVRVRCVPGDDATVRIIVEDWGRGISPDIRRRLFHPQKSTKGRGMGIGLYVAREIIETHFQGSLALDEAIVPTRFVVTLPVRRERREP